MHAWRPQPGHGQTGRRGSAVVTAPALGGRTRDAALQRFALHIQQTAGNRALQRIIIDPDKSPEESKQGKKKSFHDRPNEPHREVPLADTVFEGTKVDQSRHHIIPWNTLSAFVRTAYRKGHAAELNRVLSGAFMTMMENSPRYKQGQRGELAPNEKGGTRMQGSLTLADLRRELRKREDTGTPNKEAVDAIASAYCWMPGNLFLGPLNTLRLDDPDEDFERFAEEQVGPRFGKYKKAFDDIKAYVANPTQPLANTIANFLQSVSGVREPFPFNDGVWIRVENENAEGRFYLRKAKNSPDVQAALADIEATRRAKHQEMIDQHAKWHKDMQQVWAEQQKARKATAKSQPVGVPQ